MSTIRKPWNKTNQKMNDSPSVDCESSGVSDNKRLSDFIRIHPSEADRIQRVHSPIMQEKIPDEVKEKTI
jgi:hypothetical protein